MTKQVRQGHSNISSYGECMTKQVRQGHNNINSYENV